MFTTKFIIWLKILYVKTIMMLNCITGSLETTKVLLEAGADKGARNDINRTASQLGAFTGKFLLES